MMKRAACGTVSAFCLTAMLCLSPRPADAQEKTTAKPLVPSPTIDAPLDALVIAGDAYLLGPVQMVAPARTRSVLVHPQGRYALIVQNEAALPPGPLEGKRETGASALLLYDARLNKTRTLWQRHADGGQHNIAPFGAAWLPGTDCAVVVTVDVSLPTEPNARPVSTNTLLFFDVSKSLTAKTLTTSTNGTIMLSISPTKPFFLYQETAEGKGGKKKLWMGNGRGALGTPITLSNWTIFAGWNAGGTVAEGFELITDPPATPDAKPQSRTRWLEWDGQAAKPVETSERPAQNAMAQEPAPPALPFALQTVAVPLPPRAKNELANTLHPLYLEATETPLSREREIESAPNRSVLVAPDADQSYLLADKSAVLYEAKGALYAVPLVRVKSEAFVSAQSETYKKSAMQNADKMGGAILEYLQDHDDKFPSQADFANLIGLYARDPALLKGFTYIYPGPAQASSMDVGKTVIGYVSTPAGRAVVYASHRLKWEPAAAH